MALFYSTCILEYYHYTIQITGIQRKLAMGQIVFSASINKMQLKRKEKKG